MLATLRRHPALQRLLLIGPAVWVIGFFMVVPLCLMVVVSLLDRNIYGGVHWDTFSTEAYVKFLFERNLDDTLSFNPIYLQIFLRSFVLSAVTMIVALLFGFPVAFYMTLQREPYRTVLIFLVTVPFWTNLLVRNYAWVLLLRDTGLINGALLGIGIIEQPLPLLYTPFAVAVGLAYSFMPFMVLPIYASLEKIDFRLVEAAYDLYADRRTMLRRVVLPLAKPGIVAGSILVFVPCLGSYVTPALLGGSKTLMIGNLVAGRFSEARDWPFGAALAFFLLAMVLAAMTFQALRARRQEEAE